MPVDKIKPSGTRRILPALMAVPVKWSMECSSDPPSTRAGGQDDVSLNKLPGPGSDPAPGSVLTLARTLARTLAQAPPGPGPGWGLGRPGSGSTLDIDRG